jgi:hypothetical protein
MQLSRRVIAYLESMHKLRETLARSPPGTNAGGSLQTPSYSRMSVGLNIEVLDAYLETSRAPVDELNGTFGLDGGNGSLDILGDNVTTVEQAACHVFAFTRISLDHLVASLEAGKCHLSDRVLFVMSFVLCKNQTGCHIREVVRLTADRRGE